MRDFDVQVRVLDSSGSFDEQLITLYEYVPTDSGENTMMLTVAASNAPTDLKNRADFVCSGSNDQVQINEAIEAATIGTVTGGGVNPVLGVVQLSPGVYSLSSPIVMQNRGELRGCGNATQLEPTTSNNQACITVHPAAVGTVVSDLTIYGRSRNAHGVHYAQDQGDLMGHDLFAPDAGHLLRFLRISRCGSASNPKDGIFFEGLGNSGGRGSRILGCIVRHYSRHAYHISAFSDPKLTSCGGGTAAHNAALDCYHIATGNAEINQCGAAYAGRDAFHISSSRANLVGCKAQDAGRDGYRLLSSAGTFVTGCYADSNGRLQSGDGFHIGAGNMSLSGCTSVDRNQSTLRQQFGFRYVNGSNVVITGMARDNQAGVMAGNFVAGSGRWARIVGESQVFSVGD